jgi:hypothetical protein
MTYRRGAGEDDLLPGEVLEVEEKEVVVPLGLAEGLGGGREGGREGRR